MSCTLTRFLILNDNEHFSEYVFTEIDSQIVF